MSRLITIIAISLSIVCLGASIWLYTMVQGTPRVAIVELSKVLERYQGAQEARLEYNKTEGSLQANVDTLAKEFALMVQQYEREKAGLTKQQQQIRENELRAKQSQVSDYSRIASKQAEEQNNLLTQGVLNQIKTAGELVGKESGYDLVLSVQDNSSILFSTHTANISDEVIEYLRKHYVRPKK